MQEQTSIASGNANLQIVVPTFRYNSREILCQVDVHLAEAGLTALIGPNGSGKSTLLRIAAGLIRPRGASVLVGGRRIDRLPSRELAALIAWVPQRAETLFAMSVREMARVGAYRVERPLRPLPAAESEKIDSALSLVGLEDLADRDVETLSGGEWQRAMIARAVAQDTPVLLLDEPIASLDLRYQEEIYLLLERLATQGRLILVADHHLEVAAAHASRLLLLREGRIVGDGGPEEILTPERIAEAFGVRVHVFRDPVTGAPRVSRLKADR